MAASARHSNTPSIRRNDAVVLAVVVVAVADDGGQSF